MDASSVIAALSIMILPLIFAITLHEAAHGFVANRLGDPTARLLGRVSLNPIKHIDLIGTVILPIFMLVATHFSFLFGWAKPVPVDYRNLRHPRHDMALVAIAGPVSNLIMALMWAGLAKGFMILKDYIPALTNNASAFFWHAGIYGVMINCVLMILNLIPIPPLDGSRVVHAVLSPPLAHQYRKIEAYGIWIILGVIFFFGQYLLLPPVRYVSQLILNLFGIAP